jgi:hypothetical protein
MLFLISGGESVWWQWSVLLFLSTLKEAKRTTRQPQRVDEYVL